MKFKKDDNVIVIAGKDLGRKGKVVRIVRGEDKLVVEGVNIRKRRIRPRKMGQKGQVVEVASPVHVSNVMLFCSKCGKGRRSRVEMVKDKKTRVCVKCGKNI